LDKSLDISVFGKRKLSRISHQNPPT